MLYKWGGEYQGGYIFTYIVLYIFFFVFFFVINPSELLANKVDLGLFFVSYNFRFSHPPQMIQWWCGRLQPDTALLFISHCYMTPPPQVSRDVFNETTAKFARHTMAQDSPLRCLYTAGLDEGSGPGEGILVSISRIYTRRFIRGYSRNTRNRAIYSQKLELPLTMWVVLCGGYKIIWRLVGFEVRYTDRDKSWLICHIISQEILEDFFRSVSDIKSYKSCILIHYRKYFLYSILIHFFQIFLGLQKRLAWALFVLLLSLVCFQPTEGGGLIWGFLFHLISNPPSPPHTH